MKSWIVSLPITGIARIGVEAEDEESAIEAALNSPDLTIDNIEEWQECRQICRGNVLDVMLNEAEAEESA